MSPNPNGNATRQGGAVQETNHQINRANYAPVAEPAEVHRTGRKRYVRLFPERVSFLLTNLTPGQFVAYFRVLSQYCVRDGDLHGAASLRLLSGLPKKAWEDLVEVLTTLGIAHLDGDKWVDEDQDENLKIQRQITARQSERALARWKREKQA